MCHSRVIIQQWHAASKDARQTREYFEVRFIILSEIHVIWVYGYKLVKKKFEQNSSHYKKNNLFIFKNIQIFFKFSKNVLFI
jgi:hypothetical protein